MSWHILDENLNGEDHEYGCYGNRAAALTHAHTLLAEIWQLNSADVPPSACKELNVGDSVYVDLFRCRKVSVVKCPGHDTPAPPAGAEEES